PKCMVEIAGRPLLAHISDTFRSVGVKDIVVVRGYQKDRVNLTSLRYLDNDDYASTQEVHSLLQAESELEGPCLVSYGDVLFRKYIPQQLMDIEDDFAIAVDANWRESRNRGRVTDFVTCTEPNSKEAFHRQVFLRNISTDEKADAVHGEWMGFL